MGGFESPLIKQVKFTHFISQFPRLLVLNNFQFEESQVRSKIKQKIKWDRVCKLKLLILINNECSFTLSLNFPDIQEFTLRVMRSLRSDLFLSRVELCQNLVNFRVDGMKPNGWTPNVIESLFGLPCIKSLELVDCNLNKLDLNWFAIETSVVEHVAVGKNSVNSLTALLKNPNIRTLCVGDSLCLTGSLQNNKTENIGSSGENSLFDLVLMKVWFQNSQFQYVAGVSLYFLGYSKVNEDSKAFLTRGKFDLLHLMLKLPKEVLECVPRLKQFEYNTALIKPKHLATIVADEIILNNEGSVLKDYVPPFGCKKLQLNRVVIKGEDIKRLLGMGLDVYLDGLDAAQLFGKMENYEDNYFKISELLPVICEVRETDSELSENEVVQESPYEDMHDYDEDEFYVSEEDELEDDTDPQRISSSK